MYSVRSTSYKGKQMNISKIKMVIRYLGVISLLVIAVVMAFAKEYSVTILCGVLGLVFAFVPVTESKQNDSDCDSQSIIALLVASEGLVGLSTMIYSQVSKMGWVIYIAAAMYLLIIVEGYVSYFLNSVCS